MIRKLITVVLPIVLPFIVYWLYVYFARVKARLAGKPEPSFKEGPWGYIALVGALLAVASLVFWRFYSGQELGSLLVPFSILTPGTAPGLGPPLTPP
ncbi:MAG: hypothetical protein QNJ67_11420 [Kiloniellales bacterium]|nr:hypothetical protein [Kiloniellales bacterium]